MKIHQAIRCPNCGSMARRYFWIDGRAFSQSSKNSSLTRTECLICDYFLVTCSQTGNVVEYYAPGTNMESDRKDLLETKKQEKVPAIATI
ncbi:MAG: hypothetical protein AB4290_27455 [Spirulina sp.]